MYTLEKLLSALDALNIERAQIKSEGWYLQDCWLVQVKPGGNARTNRKYWQVRSRKPMFDGKTLKHLRADEVEDYRAAINRGRQLKQIDRQIEKLQQRLEKLTTTTPTKVTFTNMAEQERLVKEVLLKSQKLRDSLRQLGIMNQRRKTQTQETILKSQESGVRSQESGVRSQESGVRSQESGVRSQESGVRSQESGVRSQSSEARSQESGVRSQEPVVRSQGTGHRRSEAIWSGRFPPFRGRGKAIAFLVREKMKQLDIWLQLRCS